MNPISEACRSWLFLPVLFNLLGYSTMSLTWSRLENTPLLALVGKGETTHTEFKRLVHSPQKIAKSLVAFANTEGGIILIGVDDDKRIIGIHSEKEMLEVIHEAVTQHVEPEIRLETACTEYKKRLVLLVIVEESSDKPHYHIATERDPDTLKTVTRKKVYIREKSHNKVATPDRVALMESAREPLLLSFGSHEKMLLSYLEKHATITAKEFSTLAGISLNKATQTLVALVHSGAVKLRTEKQKSYYCLQHA